MWDCSKSHVRLHPAAGTFRDPGRIDWARDELNYKCFSLDVGEAGYVRFGDEKAVFAWDPERGRRRLPAPG